MGIFNGDIGQVIQVDNRNEVITVDFDGRVVEYTPDMLGELESAYAITVHKAQGSEYRAVILPPATGPPCCSPGGCFTPPLPGRGSC